MIEGEEEADIVEGEEEVEIAEDSDVIEEEEEAKKELLVLKVDLKECVCN